MEDKGKNNEQLSKELEELHRLKDEYEDFFMHAPDMFIQADAKTAKIIKCNKACPEILGYSTDEIIGKSVFDMYTPKSAVYAREKVSSLFLETGRVSGEEMQVLCKDGSIIDVSLNISAVRDKDGNIIRSRSISG